MSLPEFRHSGYTLEDWAAWDGRWELIDGIAYDMTPAPNFEHQHISTEMVVAIHSALMERREGGGSSDVKCWPHPWMCTFRRGWWNLI